MRVVRVYVDGRLSILKIHSRGRHLELTFYIDGSGTVFYTGTPRRGCRSRRGVHIKPTPDNMFKCNEPFNAIYFNAEYMNKHFEKFKIFEKIAAAKPKKRWEIC